MIKLKKRRVTKAPELMISPMIDMMFLMLVFFIYCTMNMSEIKTLDIRLPIAQNASVTTKANFNISIKSDGTIWLNDKQTDVDAVIMQALLESKTNSDFAVIISADGDGNYRNVITLLDRFKQAKITRVGLATDLEEQK
ncbi:MAG: ExbD/TolR family protein [Acidaminococcaceae bacterium]